MSVDIEPIIEDLQREVREKWPEDQINQFFTLEWGSDSLIMLHHSFGRYIRNKYKLWEVEWEPELIDGVDHSPSHPDQLSMTIIEELWKRGIPTNNDN